MKILLLSFLIINVVFAIPIDSPCAFGSGAGLPFFTQTAFQSNTSATNSVQYLDVTEKAGITFKHVNGWTGKRYFVETMGPGVAFFDYDNDGYQDLFIANGHVHDNIELFDDASTAEQKNLLLKNKGDGTFADVSETSGPGLQIKQVSRGTAFGDYDNDGDIDILVVNSNQPPSLLKNRGGNQKNWLMFKTIGTTSNRDGIGARITVISEQRSQIREVKSGSSYLSQNDMRVHFGLDTATKADVIEIRWPSGLVETFKDVEANQFLVITEGRGLKLRFKIQPPDFRFRQCE